MEETLQLASRSEMPRESQWRLEDICSSDEQWEAEFRALQQDMQKLSAYRGKLGTSASVFADALCADSECSHKVERLFVYARMRRDEDNARSVYQGMTDRAQALSVELGTLTSYMAPEILTIPDETIWRFFEEDKRLEPHRFGMERLLRKRPHMLSDKEERLMAMAGEVLEVPDTVFTMIDASDMRFGHITDEKGRRVEITHGRYTEMMRSFDRRVRKEAFEGLYESYRKQLNTIAATYSGSVKTDIFVSKARNYDSSLQASLFADNVSVDVYDKLIEAVHAHLPAMHEYMKLRKKILGVEELHCYDLYVPLVPDVEFPYTYEDSKNLVLEACKPLGKEYGDVLAGAFTDGWIDVYENRGKTSGAYSWGVYGTHPYVLLNYQEGLDHTFTLAHELGHAMHSYLSDTSLPYETAQYPILLAEVASTVNESLLQRYLLRTLSDPAQKKYLLNYYLEQFRTTVYRQVMFAEFEREAHAMAERGEPLTADSLCDLYGRLNTLYYGDALVQDEQIRWEWARIPHFYRAFYVYKYATGFSSAVALTKRILEEGDGAVADYLQFLRSGGSRDPLPILRDAGVDLETPQPVSQCLEAFAAALHEFAELM